MFVDELTITAKAGDGGNGVVRWRHEKYRPLAGPAGGNGGHGGHVYVRAVKDMNRLSKYTGANHFEAQAGESGTNQSQHGKNGSDLYIDIPVGSRVTDCERERSFELLEDGMEVKILTGGGGGLGNEHFKSSTNQSPEESTEGRPGEEGRFLVEVALAVDVGLVGFPNAGKSTLLNLLTNARSTVGAYPFTTLEPHLGSFYGHTIADIPGLLSGAAEGKGLGHKFLRHVSRTKMILHLISLEDLEISNSYYTIRDELSSFDISLTEKEEWIVLTKKDLVEKGNIDDFKKDVAFNEKRVFVISEKDENSVKELRDALVQKLSQTYNVPN